MEKSGQSHYHHGMHRQSEYSTDFPPLEQATSEGLLAIGGDLSVERLLDAYSRGIFPWFNPGQPVLWWSPDPRMVLFPEEIRITRSLKKSLRNKNYTFTADTCFDRVIRQCAAPRYGQIYSAGESWSWITPEMIIAYEQLHAMGLAHSIECWQDGELAGGLYGIALGDVFFGESMFSLRPDSSKCALAMLCQWAPERQIRMIDCQVHSAHLASLGARDISRHAFAAHLSRGMQNTTACEHWHFSDSRGN